MVNQRTTLLLIENDAQDATAIRDMLSSRQGDNTWVLTWTSTLEDAYRLLDHAGKIDAILLDWQLPGGGQTAFGRLREHTRLPIILYSLPEDEALASRLIQAGAQDFLVKGEVNSDGLARSVRYAIERQRTALALDERNQEIQLLYEAGQALSRTLDLERLYETFMHILRKAMPCDHLFISSFDPVSKMITCVFAMSGKVILDASQLPPIPLEPPGIGKQSQVIRSGKSMLKNDWNETPSLNNYFMDDDSTVYTEDEMSESEEDYTRSGIIVPIIFQERVVGAIQILSTRLNAYSENDLRVAEALSAQIAVAANNAILYQQTRRELNERKQAAMLQEAVYRIAEAAQTTDSLQDLYHQIHRQVAGVMHAENFYIALADETASALRFVYFVDEHQNLPGGVYPLDQGLTGRVMGSGKSLLFAHDHADGIDDPFGAEQMGKHCKIWLGVPLVARSKTIGVMAVQHYTDSGVFTEREQRMLEYVSSQVATAIERKLANEQLQALNRDLERRVEERTAQVRQSRDELSAANAAIQKASQMKDEFLASMSHELRTPLTGILGLSEIMLMQTYGSLNEKQIKAMQNIESSGRHLLDLINDILDLSKVEAGKLELQIETCQVAEICQASLQLVKGMAHQKKQTVNFNMRPTALTVRADPRRLKQMLVNLLSNAVKFTPNGGELGLDVQANATDQVVLLSVWDKGIGNAPENLEKLFKPFTQLDSSLARQYSGTGLGLSLVQRMAELHGGSILVESMQGQGSRFTISLPWAPQPAEPPSHPANLPVRAASAGPSANPAAPEDSAEPNGLVLIADDNDLILNTIGSFLESRGYLVFTTHSGFELLERAPELYPDIILVDIQMPGMDGMETMRRLRRHGNPAIASVPIIAVTALAMTGDREKCLQAGANDYISKPVALTQLADRINTLLTQNRK